MKHHKSATRRTIDFWTRPTIPLWVPAAVLAALVASAFLVEAFG